METKFILGSVRREAEKLGAQGDATHAVRLSGSVNGDRGEGYWLLYPESLILLYRKLGDRDYGGVCAAPEEWHFGNYREAQYELAIELSCDDAVYDCVFTPSERGEAEAVLNTIQTAAAKGVPRYAETLLLAAALIWQLSGDGHAEYARRILGSRYLAAGRRYAESATLSDLVSRAARMFSPEQKQSLMLNLIEQRMSDGEWTGAEQQALGELAAELGQAAEEFAGAWRTLLLKNRCPAIFG